MIFTYEDFKNEDPDTVSEAWDKYFDSLTEEELEDLYYD